MNENIGMNLRPRRSVLSDISNRNQNNETKGYFILSNIMNIYLYLYIL